MTDKEKEKKIKELKDRILNHTRELKSIEAKEGRGAGKSKRGIIKGLNNQLLFLLRL
tara:strand:- start:4156 stop:4326 length:171 start_codon:yes stop_codon:yes gene_type:complete